VTGVDETNVGEGPQNTEAECERASLPFIDYQGVSEVDTDYISGFDLGFLETIC
jgi:hypothetical protein